MENEGAFGFRDEGLIERLNQLIETHLWSQVHTDLKKDHGLLLQTGNERSISVKLVNPGCGICEFDLNQEYVCLPPKPEVWDMELARGVFDPTLGKKRKLSLSRPEAKSLPNLPFIPQALPSYRPLRDWHPQHPSHLPHPLESPTVREEV